MSEAVVDDIVAVLPPLLQSLEALGFVARHLYPPEFGRVMEAAGTPDEALRARARQACANGPSNLPTSARRWRPRAMRRSPRSTACARCRTAMAISSAVFRALRYAPRAQEALYPLAAKLPPVSEFFLDPPLRDDAALLARLAQPANDNTGIIHVDNEPGSRGGYSLYVPEYYTPDRRWPLVMALHGGSGNGRDFLWSWLRDARSHGAILVAPTATGSRTRRPGR